jgi:uncharacterized protein YbjT (DUF2867 family)
MIETAQFRPMLVLGGTGKTGRRLVAGLTRRDIPVRIGSRSARLPFDWDRPSTWGPVFSDVEAAYIYVPDLVVSNPTDAIAGVVETALAAGTGRLVLLSGRADDKAQACEKILTSSGADWTILRASFFNQNFSEGHLLDPILAGQVMLPVGDVGEPLCDIEDIADVAATVLTEDGHVGEVYELTGPRALTFAEATATIAEATGRDITYTRIPPEDFAAGLAADGVPLDIIDVLVDLFGTVLDGRNAEVADGVERVLGRPARNFADYARATAATGIWNPTDQPNPGGPR